MGVSNAPKGFDLFLENGWAHDVVARAGRFELRHYPGQRMWTIAAHTSLLAAVAHVERDMDGWLVRGNLKRVPAHKPFSDPVAAFEWWVSIHHD